MGVDYTYSSGYGIVLEREDFTEDLIYNIEYCPVWDSFTSHEEWLASTGDDILDDLDIDDVIEFLCRKYKLEYSSAGNHYTGEVCWLIGSVHSDSNYWFDEISINNSLGDIHQVKLRLERLKLDLGFGINKKISYYSGMAVS